LVPSDAVVVPGFNQFSSNVWWTITQNANPLPVSMLDLVAKTYNDRVKLTWETASEINNSHFIIERTTDQVNFDYIGRAESKGPSTSTLNYSIWDEQPLQGIQYYYLRQYDINGTMKSYGPVSATFSRDLFDIVTATATNSEKGLIVDFDYNTDEPYKYSVVDVLGKVIATQDKNVAQPGRNRIEIDVKLSQGVYQIILQNSEKVVSKKFYFDKL
ncbi:MAG TPA: T9SS type A sorting domain-containing protein, partial [Bacteroidia bacterium]|nr:T9SS type A sorting domain-containing protein [Bacteroidia bacterium]